MAKNIDIPNGWEVKKLGKVVEINNTRVLTEKLEPLSISAGIGFVNQTEKFGRDLSGKQYEKYIKIQKYDFAYNKGNSKKYPQGCVYLLKDREYAAIPNVFECFRIKKHNCFYYEQLFISGYLNKQLFRLINAGVRNDGLLNINSENFYSCYIPVPPLAEQEKIAEILSLWDKAIEQTKELIAYKEKQKKGLMQNLLTGKKRLHGFTDKWKTVKLGEVAEIYQPKTIANSDFIDIGYDVYGANGIIGKYHLFNHELPQIAIACRGSSCGIVNMTNPKSWITGNAMVVNTDTKQAINKFFLFYLLCFSNLKYLISGGAQPQITSNIQFHKIFIPNSLDEQKAIADILCKADEEIELLKKQLDLYTEQKKGLMQNLLTGKIRV